MKAYNLAVLLVVVGGWRVPAILSQNQIPHVDDCNYCFKCRIEEPVQNPRRLLAFDDANDGPEPPFTFYPTKKEWATKDSKPNCTECYGCKTKIEPLRKVVVSMFGQSLKTDVGASPEWLFYADLPDTPHTGQRAIIKVWCMPYDKNSGRYRRVCDNGDRGRRGAQFLLAQQQAMRECGLLDVTVRVWVARVNAVIPELGFHVWWEGLWMERAPGVSLHQLSYKAQRNFLRDTLDGLLHTKLNTTRVVHAAIYDLLTSQNDRHAENVLIDASGGMKLIDNINALRNNWGHATMLDSIFLPGTQKFEIARHGGSYVFKLRGAKPRKTVNPTVLFDYRCYVPGGLLRNQYPPQVAQCLASFASSTPRDLMLRYSFPYLRNADALHARAKDMLHKGYEWTLKYGEPLNPAPKRYRLTPPCCRLSLDADVRCATPWAVANATMPRGDPATGGAWHRPYPDPGTFIGGSHLDD